MQRTGVFLVKAIIAFVFLTFNYLTYAEDGYELWLRYPRINDSVKLEKYNSQVYGLLYTGNSKTVLAAKEEMIKGLSGLLDKKLIEVNEIKNDEIIVAGTPTNSSLIADLKITDILDKCGEEGYCILTKEIKSKQCIVISANTDIGILYGTFHFLRLIQTNKDIDHLTIIESPKIKYRLLNHWDNLNGTVERGYSGFSIWNWHLLPEYISQQYIDYARANASIGINGTVLTNVNANAWVLTPQYLEKVAALADVFRPYGIKVYLTARFSAPREIGGLKTADPLNADVINWWKNKITEIYKYIPDFGGFLVKANSEGQPGPQNYKRNQAEGANMLANALKPFGGIVMWRAFVYEYNAKEDRAKQANNEFEPLDGKFTSNALVQVKNGAIDFQPREPFHPMFGAMPKTPLMLELQITQEYLGQGTHLVYLAPLYKECLESDTYVKGEGSTVAKIVDGTLDDHAVSGMAGVANIGTDKNWCGHPFAQANWYAFGRLAWDHTLTSDEIADEWLRMTFTNNGSFVNPVKNIMLDSRETCVNYMAPLGLHHIMGWSHHYGPGPWVKRGRPDWTSPYYHHAEKNGLGFDRTETGSDAISQYSAYVMDIFGSIDKCPEKYLLWFHHVNWDYKMRSGRTLWDELCYKYYDGVNSVRNMKQVWASLNDYIDKERYDHVNQLLDIQEKEAVMWRNACLLYFQTFSKKAIQDDYEQPDKTLDYYKNLDFRYAPGILHCK